MDVIYPGGDGPIIIRGGGEVVQSTNEHVPIGAVATAAAPRAATPVSPAAAAPAEPAQPGAALIVETAPATASTQSSTPPNEEGEPAVLHVPDPEEKKTAPEPANDSPDTASVQLIY